MNTHTLENQPKEVSLVKSFTTSLEHIKPKFVGSLPSHISADRFVSVVNVAVTKNQDLLRLDRESLYTACLQAATDGLLPNGIEAALVPFKGKVVYMPMVRGIISKILQEGSIKVIESEILHVNDEFKYYLDETGRKFLHVPNLNNPGKRIGVFAIAYFNGGGMTATYLPEQEIWDIKKCSKVGNGPWNGPFEEEMWKKSAIRRLAKKLPSSPALEKAFARDDDFYDEGNTKVELVKNLSEDEVNEKRVNQLLNQEENQNVPI